MMGKYQLFIYVCLASSAYAEDLRCKTGTRTECVKADLCPQHVKDRDQLKSLASGSFLYKNLLSRLKRHICNKVEKKICCNKGRTTEIAYGSDVDYAFAKKSYPFMARIILDGNKCGGALISDRFVATARHCLEFCPCFNEANPSNDWTRCNKLCFLKLRENSDLISDTETVHIIKTIHLPENSGKPYETRGQRTDFALIELAESANTCTQEETARGRCWPVTPVRLPDPSFQIKEGQKVRTLGWGATEFSFGDEQSEFLAQLDITVNSSTVYHFLIETNIGPNSADPCKGDSGGPLLLRGDDLEWTLVGTLVGGGYACENPGGKDTTSDWNKIALHVPWITSVMGTTTVDKPVHCKWRNWEAWGSCSASCGYAAHTRRRKITQPALHGGDGCSGSDFQSEDCLLPNCPVDGRWANWGSWSTVGSCSKTFGGGQQQYQRKRSCSNSRPESKGNYCPGKDLATTSQSCNTQSCPVDGRWANWGSWSTVGSCSKSCGGGQQQYQRMRNCSNPRPESKGNYCPGKDLATTSQSCNTQSCPAKKVDGRWANWGSWSTVSSCSKTCGGGQQQLQRRRSCSNPRPESNGNYCPGKDLATTSQSCNTQSCPGGVGFFAGLLGLGRNTYTYTNTYTHTAGCVCELFG